ncbi:MAG: FeoA family protein [Desulfovibrio sp.]|uniref:FeoA family protein n=1 Tax=Desulfovibrio sp. 7SRBS1 TaxID=3378064 RepID=UPI003B3C1FF8
MTQNIVAEARPLTAFPKGSKVTIHSFCAGGKARCRLCAMGLTPGTSVELGSNGSGPCRVKVRGADVVLGRGLADKILAKLM